MMLPAPAPALPCALSHGKPAASTAAPVITHHEKGRLACMAVAENRHALFGNAA